jgi:four helix bundle protein
VRRKWKVESEAQVNYQEWMLTVPEEIRQDPLWSLEVYRLGLLVGDITWVDTEQLDRHSHTRGAADQIRRSLDSISANIAEGYSRSTGKDRARYFEYSVGEAREARDRYYKVRHALKQEAVAHRIKLLTQIIKILNSFVPTQRKRGIREEQGVYIVLSEFENEIIHQPLSTS